jgi:potassium-transporting ATPase potassium-binding subunit
MNNPGAWFQFALYSGLLLLMTKPLGLYLIQVLDVRGKTWLDPVVGPIERLTYRVCGIDPEREQGWTGYTTSLLVFSLVPRASPPTPIGTATAAKIRCRIFRRW